MIDENELDKNTTQETNKNEVDTIDSNELIRKTADDLTLAIAKAESKEELEALYQKFNINNTKKNALRINQLNNLLDQVNQQAVERFNRRPETVSNKEILDYMNAIQNQIERSQRTVDGIKDITAIQVNNTQNNTVNIHVKDTDIPYLSKDSRDRITDLVASILQESNKVKNEDIIDITETIEAIENPTENVSVEDDEFTGDE